MLTSTRYGVNYPQADRSDSADVPRDFASVVAGLEQSAMYGQGTLAARPAFGKSGRVYAATDQTPQQIYWDTGTLWFQVGALANGAVGTAQLALLAVTTAILADSSVTSAKIVDGTIATADIGAGQITATLIANALKPSAGAGAGTEALRALGTAAGTAAAGTHASQHAPGAADPLDLTLVHRSGTLAARPAATTALNGIRYLATDTNGGTEYQVIAAAWSQVAAAVSGAVAPAAHAASHQPGGSDVLTLEGRQINRHRGVSPPASPADGDLWEATVDGTNGIYWLFRYNAGSASGFKWEFLGGPPMVAFDNNDEGSAGGFQPAVNPRLTLPRSGDYYMSFRVQLRGAPNAAEQPHWTVSLDVVGVGLLIPTSNFWFIQGGTSGVQWYANLGAGPIKQINRNAGEVLALYGQVANWDFTANMKTIEVTPIRVS